MAEGASDYSQYALVPTNTTSFVDNAVTEGHDYCYRVSAFNSVGESDYTEETCAHGLTVSLAGAGTGTVAGSGINCGTDCAETYPSALSVPLTASPNTGSYFTGWGGDGDCVDGIVSMSAAKNCTATFELEPSPPPPPPPSVTLTVNVIQTLTAHGTGNGSVSSDPPGISCETDCSESFPAGTVVTLTANAEEASIFIGWTGGGCSGASICTTTLDADTTINARFEPLVFTLIVSVVGPGRVTGAGIDCGEICSETYRSGEVITLTATAEAGGTLESWGGSGCIPPASCEVTMTEDMTIAATFTEPAVGIPMVIGEVDVDHNWTRVELDGLISDPVVITTTASDNDSDPGVVRIRSVDATGFYIRFQEWDYLDDVHATESVGYLVIKRGQYTLEDGTLVEANSFDTDVTTSYELVSFNQGFNVTPVVLTTISTVNDTDAVTTRVRNVNTQGFEFRLQKQEANTTSHPIETIGYLALEPFLGNIEGINFEVGRTGDVVSYKKSSQWFSLSFNQPFTSGPIVLARMQTSDSEDTAVLRWQNRSSTEVEIQIEEERSRNPEVNHTTEDVGYMVLE